MNIATVLFLSISYAQSYMLYIHPSSVGQFFRPDVSLDEDNKLLILPGRSPLPIKERSTFNFMHNEISSGQKCWTSVKLSRQLIEGSFRDYHVDGILSTGFKFGTGNHSAV